MGRYADELRRVVGSANYGLDRDATALLTVLDNLGDTISAVASEPGWSGASADAASELFSTQARRARANSDIERAAVSTVRAANEALDRARAAHADLPPGEMSPGNFAGAVAGGWILLGPFGAFSGLAGATYANAVLGFNREQEARPIIVGLQSELRWLAGQLGAHASQLQVSPGARPSDIPGFPGDREESSLSPWEIGWEWLTGTGNSREFEEQDEFTQLLREHPHYQELRESLRAQYDSLYVGRTLPSYNYELTGVGGVGKYIVDYSTLLTGGATGNLAVTYLGSHTVELEVIGQRPDGGYEVRITAHNTSSLQSALRPPVIGYQPWYRDTVGAATNQFAEFTGVGRETEQTLVWTETVYP